MSNDQPTAARPATGWLAGMASVLLTILCTPLAAAQPPSLPPATVDVSNLDPIGAASASGQLQQLAKTLRDDPSAATAAALVPQLVAMSYDPLATTEVLPIIEQTIDLLPSGAAEQPIHSHLATLLKTAARLRYDQADAATADQHLQRLLTLYRALHQQDTRPGAASRWSHRIVEVAMQYLRGDQLAAALDVLSEAADLEVPPTEAWADHRVHLSAALHRRLETLDTFDRFELLHRWVLPQDATPRVRSWSSLTPTEAPPPLMARALGERPRADAFPLPQINGLTGLYSVGWQLVLAAEQSGQLRGLISQLNELAQQQIPGADHLLLLARIAAAGDPPDQQLMTDVGRVLTAVAADRASAAGVANATAAAADPAVTAADPLTATITAAACWQRPWLQPISQQILQQLSNTPHGDGARRLNPLLRRAAAMASQRSWQDARADLLDDPRLQLWLPTVADDSHPTATGKLPGIWLSHEQHLLHIPGAGADYLCFRYPLSGAFTFHAETQWAGSSEPGHITFGGVSAGPSGNGDAFQYWWTGGNLLLQRSFAFLRREAWPTYQRLALQVSDGHTALRINGHPTGIDLPTGGTSPWLGIGGGNDGALFRNLRITGDAVIPRAVALSDDPQLRGWHSPLISAAASRSPAMPAPDLFPNRFGAYSQSRSPLVSPPVSPVGGVGWSAAGGMIYGARSHNTAAPRLLSYFRPLQASESIEYEFLYQPGHQAVHPALGRLVFLIEADGIQLRWVTSGEDDWTGLTLHHAVAEPLARRGPRQLPLLTGDWNRVSLAIDGDRVVTLTLNGTVVYSRHLEPELSRRFAFYHDASRSEARIRGVVMRGDWPQRLGDLQSPQLAIHDAAAPPPTDSDRRAAADLLAERHIADAALDVHRRAVAMPIGPRHDFLAQWVLPSPDHPDLRLALDFVPTEPSPLAMADAPVDTQAELWQVDAAEQGSRSRVAAGGNLVAPALDLIAAAKETGQLDALRQQVDQAPQYTDHQRRSRLALLALVDIAREDFQPALDALFELFRTIESAEHTAFAQRWPETLALYGSLQHAETRVAGRELAYHLFLRQARNGADSGSEAWRRHVIALSGLARRLDEAAEISADGDAPVPSRLTQWQGVSRSSARTRGQGFPNAFWQLGDDGPQNLASHDHDFLYFQSPLGGSYEIQCEMPAFNWRDTQLTVAGHWAGLIYTRKDYEHGTLRTTRGRFPTPVPLTKVGSWLTYRTVVRDDQSTTYVNGRQLHDQPLAADPYPWLAVRAPRENGAARNVRIVPLEGFQIPAQLRLSTTPDLAGWIPYHDSYGVGSAQSGWLRTVSAADRGEITGRLRPEWSGMCHESLLRYHRPMLEDGAIQYEFYYRRGSVLCHPALDRLAFLLDPGGVRIHWITDGPYDRTGVDADNWKPAGTEPLPLKHDAWNQLSLTLEGDTVRLALNGQRVYEHALEPTNQRCFGLFHYADQTEARIRNVTWQGDWPRDLPSLAEQELSHDPGALLDPRAEELPAVFVHDFASDGLPANQFSLVHGEVPHHFQTASDGLHVQRPGEAGYRNATLAPRLKIQGDFDVTIAYDQLTTDAALAGSASLVLMALFDDPASQECMLYRRQNRSDIGFEEQFLQSALVSYEGQTARRQYSSAEPFEATSGRLRLARRGDTVYFLVAEGDSPLFRLLRTEQVTAEDVAMDGIRVLSQTKEAGHLSVVLKSLVIRGEALSGQALEDDQQTIAELDRQRSALPAHFLHEFARDAFTPARFYHWTFAPPARPQPGGLAVTQRGTDQWTSAGATPHVTVTGDFDIAFQFDVLRMDTPAAGQTSAVYLQLEFPGPQQLQCNMLAKATPEGSMLAAAQVRLTSADGTFTYPSLRQDPVERVQRMRMARRGTELFFLYGQGPSQPDQLLARYQVPDGAIADSNIRLMVHTGGAGRITDTRWQRLRIDAAQVTPAP